MIDASIVKIMVESPTASAAIKALYELHKAWDANRSLAYFCKKAGIKSKGYLSDIVRGRRTLNAKFAPALAAAFGLKGPGVRAFTILVDLESADLRGAALAHAQERLAKARRSLLVERGAPLPRELAGLSLAFEVYCAFGLFKNAPTHAELLHYFGQRHAVELDQALAMLARHGLIETAEGHLRATKNAVIFGASGVGFDHLDFLRACLRDAERALKAWFPRKDESYIESVILSVRKADYLRLLPLLRERMLDARSSLDTEDADLLVRFNVQIYPVRTPT